MPQPSQPPRSVTSVPICLAALLSLLAGLAWIPGLDLPVAARAILIGLCWAVPVIVLEHLFRHPLACTESLKRQPLRPLDLKRSATKWLGLAATFATIGFVYWLFPEYHGDFYNPVWDACRWIIPTVLLLALVYIPWVDRCMPDPEDGYYQYGLWLLGRTRQVRYPVLGQYALGWLVKAFFLPLMFVYLNQNINGMPSLSWNGFQPLFDLAWHWLFTIDLVIAATGYALTLRLFDAQIRSTEPTLLGWLAALVCYQPFWSLIGTWYLAYDTDGLAWGGWLADSPLLYTLWGSAILLLIGIYVMASVSFGIRFSNLTHRGIITNGAYRWSKHPAYLSKNLSWWLIALPFLHPEHPIEALRNCALLLMLNGIYYLRAKTEERHLARDPVYRDYMAFMQEHALLAVLRRQCRRLMPRRA